MTTSTITVYECKGCHKLVMYQVGGYCEECVPDAEAARLLDVLKDAPADYPPGLLAARRIAFTRQIEQYNAGSDGLWNNTKEIAVNVAAYNLAHVSEKNKAWAEKRLQEELNKGGGINE